MTALTRFTQQVNGAAGHHLTAMADKGFEHLFEIENLGLAIDQRHHVDAKYRLHGGLGIKIIEHHVAYFATAKLYHDAHAVFVRFITQLCYALDRFIFDELRDTFNQTRLVQLVG